jgi:response regulator RpfG family c-di-GMP phosphodiesterase
MGNRQSHCVLVVDDEPDVCDSVHDLLRREFRVLKANDAAEGFRLLRDEDVHIVMTDQRMPLVSGVELLTSLKSRAPHAIRLLFTGFADLESIIAAINQGQVFQFLKKPWDPNELLEAVRLAAAEYDRLAALAIESERVQQELQELKRRVETLEREMQKLNGKGAAGD